MEHSSSSALLYLSHWLYLCTYYDDVYIYDQYNKPEPQLKRGICLFSLYHVWLHGGFYFIKRRPVYPLIQLIKALYKNHLGAWLHLNHSYTSWSVQCHNITWGLGHIRTISYTSWSAQGHQKNHLGAWSYSNHSHTSWSAQSQITSGPKRVLQKNNSNIGTHWAQLKCCLGALCFSKNKKLAPLQ